MTPTDAVLELGPLCFWDFREPAGRGRIARGRHPYRLREGAGPVAREPGGWFGAHAAPLA